VGRWLSQQPAEQNTNFTRPELQVLTEHRIAFPPTGIGLRHMEQTKAAELVIGNLDESVKTGG
jgi:hypothetical protein